MNLLSKKIALFFVRKNRISAEETDLYTYCFEMALSAILNFSIIIFSVPQLYATVLEKKFFIKG